jgi:hypothetical protein
MSDKSKKEQACTFIRLRMKHFKKEGETRKAQARSFRHWSWKRKRACPYLEASLVMMDSSYFSRHLFFIF